RRRHTRFDCDWSSDVCSSDLQRGDSRQQREDQDLFVLLLVRHSWAVLKQDKEILIFPLLSGIASLAVAASFIVPLVIFGMHQPEIGRASCREGVEVAVVVG